MQAPAGGFTSGANLSICGQLYTWWTTHRRGRVFDSSGGFFLGDGSMLNPDASYVLPQKLVGLTKDDMTKFPKMCPDFVIELLSVTDSVPEAEEKLERWIENGAALAWLIDPYKKQVYVYQPGRGVFIERGKLLHGSGPVEGFTLDLHEVWQCYEI